MCPHISGHSTYIIDSLLCSVDNGPSVSFQSRCPSLFCSLLYSRHSYFLPHRSNYRRRRFWNEPWYRLQVYLLKTCSIPNAILSILHALSHLMSTVFSKHSKGCTLPVRDDAIKSPREAQMGDTLQRSASTLPFQVWLLFDNALKASVPRHVIRWICLQSSSEPAQERNWFTKICKLWGDSGILATAFPWSPVWYNWEKKWSLRQMGLNLNPVMAHMAVQPCVLCVASLCFFFSICKVGMWLGT